MHIFCRESGSVSHHFSRTPNPSASERDGEGALDELVYLRGVRLVFAGELDCPRRHAGQPTVAPASPKHWRCGLAVNAKPASLHARLFVSTPAVGVLGRRCLHWLRAASIHVGTGGSRCRRAQRRHAHIRAAGTCLKYMSRDSRRAETMRGAIHRCEGRLWRVVRSHCPRREGIAIVARGGERVRRHRACEGSSKRSKYACRTL